MWREVSKIEGALFVGSCSWFEDSEGLSLMSQWVAVECSKLSAFKGTVREIMVG